MNRLLLLIISIHLVISCKKEKTNRTITDLYNAGTLQRTTYGQLLEKQIDSITPCKIFGTNICISIDVTNKHKREEFFASISQKVWETNSTENYTILIYSDPLLINKLKLTKENYPFSSEDFKVELINVSPQNRASHYELSEYYVFLGEDASAEYITKIDTLLMKRFTHINFTSTRFTYLFPHQQHFKRIYFECISGTDSAVLHRYGTRIFGFYTPESATIMIVKTQTETMTEGIERKIPKGYH